MDWEGGRFDWAIAGMKDVFVSLENTALMYAGLNFKPWMLS
jgi:hypothetical protein